jgi:hypothetical protein
MQRQARGDDRATVNDRPADDLTSKRRSIAHIGGQILSESLETSSYNHPRDIDRSTPT